MGEMVPGRGGLILLLIFATSLAGCATTAEVFDPYPTDSQMIEALIANRSKCEVLVQMFEEDSGLSHFDSNGETGSVDKIPVTSLPEQRKQSYLELMKATGVRNISRNRYDSTDRSILLQVWWVPNGIFLSSKSKYYLYKDSHQTKLVESLDDVYAEGRDANDTRRIDSNWSLYLDVW